MPTDDHPLAATARALAEHLRFHHALGTRELALAGEPALGPDGEHLLLDEAGEPLGDGGRLHGAAQQRGHADLPADLAEDAGGAQRAASFEGELPEPALDHGEHGLGQRGPAGSLEPQDQLDALEAANREIPGQRLVEADRARRVRRVALGEQPPNHVDDEASVVVRDGGRRAHEIGSSYLSTWAFGSRREPFVGQIS